ncbi:MAG: hypothetical protein MUP11_01355 [Anaerolineales bacterium]|nr:hypothetical protein [Anaerolineales bacterium]
MKILALEKDLPGGVPEKFSELAEAEARRVWELIKEDKIREIVFRRDQNSAVITLECKDLAEAEEILSSLPLVENHLIEFDLIPLKPYPGLERLFKKYNKPI